MFMQARIAYKDNSCFLVTYIQRDFNVLSYEFQKAYCVGYYLMCSHNAHLSFSRYINLCFVHLLCEKYESVNVKAQLCQK